jgi:hypothetical protein
LLSPEGKPGCPHGNHSWIDGPRSLFDQMDVPEDICILPF